jgi:hypothetical protein
VVDVVALDRSLFDAANAAKRRVHLCNGAPGTLDVDESFFTAPASLMMGPFVPPWTAHFIFFCPMVLAPQICNLFCYPHKDMEFPPWADHALIVTDKGVVGRRQMRPDGQQAKRQAMYARYNLEVSPYERDVNAIAWDGFDVDKIVVRRYAEDKGCYWKQGMCDCYAEHNDPLSYALGFGLFVPCCWKVLCNPTTPGLYRAKIMSDHTTTVSSGESSATYSTAQISLIALARSPDDLVASLRAAKAKYEAPAAAAMDRSHAPPATSGDSGPKVSVRVGCSVM